ncbi:hypothetical protein E2320_006535 [Naja naja]|nr:hypothetical protein E2320_006535 [Naja naja]
MAFLKLSPSNPLFRRSSQENIKTQFIKLNREDKVPNVSTRCEKADILWNAVRSSSTKTLPSFFLLGCRRQLMKTGSETPLGAEVNMFDSPVSGVPVEPTSEMTKS